MNALLVWPKFSSFSFWNFEEVCSLAGAKYMTPPLGLLTVAALLPREWELRVVDENVSPLTAADFAWAEVVFVSSKIVHRKRALEVVREARALGKRVVVGGPDPTLSGMLYKEAGADFLCVGEGEATVPKLLAAFESGAGSGVLRGDLPAMAQSPVPRFDLIDPRHYLYVGIQYSRGCPHNCEFCNVIDLFDHKFRTKAPEQIVRELSFLFELGYRGQVDFFDDNLVGNVPKAKALLRELIAWSAPRDYPFFFSTSVTLNIAKDEELLGLFRQARFKYFLVGIETPDEAALKAAKKPQNVGFSMAEAVDRIYRLAGATVHSGFLLGLDGESSDIGDQILRCIDDTQIPWVMAGVVYPLPGTQLAKRLDREGRLFPSARAFDDETVRDQISAGVQFKTQRPVLSVLGDLVRVLRHAYDPERYFSRCAEVALRLDTLPAVRPNLLPNAWATISVLLRHLRTFARLCWRATANGKMRSVYWRAFWRVVFRNPAGVEAMATLSVLYLHFERMLPYVYEQLERQQSEIAAAGETEWLSSRLEDPGAASPIRLPVIKA